MPSHGDTNRDRTSEELDADFYESLAKIVVQSSIICGDWTKTEWVMSWWEEEKPAGLSDVIESRKSGLEDLKAYYDGLVQKGLPTDREKSDLEKSKCILLELRRYERYLLSNVDASIYGLEQ